MAAEHKSTGDTGKEEFPACEVGRITLRWPRYVTDYSLSTTLGELYVRLPEIFIEQKCHLAIIGWAQHYLSVCALLLKVFQEYLCSPSRWTKRGRAMQGGDRGSTKNIWEKSWNITRKRQTVTLVLLSLALPVFETTGRIPVSSDIVRQTCWIAFEPQVHTGRVTL